MVIFKLDFLLSLSNIWINQAGLTFTSYKQHKWLKCAVQRALCNCDPRKNAVLQTHTNTNNWAIQQHTVFHLNA